MQFRRLFLGVSFVVVVEASLVSCTGSLTGDDTEPRQLTPSAGSPASGGSPAQGQGGASNFQSNAPAATPVLSRLSVTQWANTVRDLFALEAASDLDEALRKDAVVRFDNEADSLFVDQALHDDLQAQAERLALLISGDAKAVARLVPASAPADVAGKTQAYLRHFGRKIYRRPMSDAELAQYTELFNQGSNLTAGMGAFEAGVRVTLEAFLQSPDFLYRTTIGGAPINGRARANDYELAANLAYALTNHPPDAELSLAAEQGSLESPEAIKKHAERLLGTSTGKAAIDRFFFQYFGLGQYDTLQKDAAVAPDFGPGTGVLLHREAEHLLSYLFEQNLGLREIFTSPVAFVNASVAKLYGLQGTFAEDSWTQVSFDAAQRPGLLTRLGFLSYYAHQERQDTIHRGANINSRILCAVLAPPENVQLPALPPPDPNRTNRKLVEEFTSACGAGCHTAFINPAGFAFENFDGLGRYRTLENAQPIDASGSYAFQDGAKDFANVAEFAELLAQSNQAHSCYTQKWTANLYGRLPRRDDENAAAALASRSVSEHLSSKDVVLSLVTHEAFAHRVVEP